MASESCVVVDGMPKPQALVEIACPACSGALTRARGGRHCWRCVRAVARIQWEAYIAMRKAMRQGALAHPSTLYCVDCGAFASRYDHRDYLQPLRVDPVCASCNVRRGSAVQFAPNSIEHISLAA